MRRIEKPSIGLTFFTQLDINSRKIGYDLLLSILDIGKDFSPTKVNYKRRWRSVKQETLENIIDEWEKADNLVFRKENKYESELAVLLGKTTNGYSILSYWVDESYFEDGNHINIFLSLTKDIYYIIRPEYGKIHQTQDSLNMATIQDPIYGKTIYPVNLDKGLPGIYWVNIFGMKITGVLGRNKLLSAQCYETIELSDGGIFIRTSASPLYPNRDRKQQIVLRKYLGESFFYPTINL